MTKEETDKIFNRATANGMREMTRERFHQAVNEAVNEIKQGRSEGPKPCFPKDRSTKHQEG